MKNLFVERRFENIFAADASVFVALDFVDPFYKVFNDILEFVRDGAFD